MKIYELAEKYNDIENYLSMTDFENYFNIYYYHDKYNYNLNSSLYFKIDDEMLDEYILESELHWTIISYKLYGTTRLVWLLLKLNNVKAKDIFKAKHPGDIIKYINKEEVKNIVADLNGFYE